MTAYMKSGADNIHMSPSPCKKWDMYTRWIYVFSIQEVWVVISHKPQFFLIFRFHNDSFLTFGYEWKQWCPSNLLVYTVKALKMKSQWGRHAYNHWCTREIMIKFIMGQVTRVHGNLCLLRNTVSRKSVQARGNYSSTSKFKNCFPYFCKVLASVMVELLEQWGGSKSVIKGFQYLWISAPLWLYSNLWMTGFWDQAKFVILVTI
mgnify:CR=1 FL=1